MIHEGGWVLLAQLASVFGSLALVRVLTEYLSPAEYGDLALALSVGGVITQVITGGIGNSISRFYSIALKEKKLYSYYKASLILTFYAIVFSFIAGSITVLYLYKIDQTAWVLLAMLVLIFSIINFCNTFVTNIQNAARKRLIVALNTGLDALLKVLLVLYILKKFNSSSEVVIVGYILGAVIVTVLQIFFLLKLINTQIFIKEYSSKQEWIKKMWSYAWPFSTWGMFSWAQQISDRWALNTFSSIENVGQYVAVFQLGYTPIIILTTLAVSFIGPILFQHAGDNSDPLMSLKVHKMTWKLTAISLVVTVLAFIFTFLCHNWLFKFLVAESFREASNYLPWLALAGGIFASGQVLSLNLMSQMKSKEMILIKIITAIVGIAANVLGAWKFGISGVILGLITFSLIYFTWMAFLTESHIKNLSAIKKL